MHPWLAVEGKEVLKWVFIKSVEHRRQVTLTSIRQQGDDGLSGILRTLGDEGGTIGGGTGGDSYQQTVFPGRAHVPCGWHRHCQCPVPRQ